jgi:hypothetical protein
MEIKQISCNCKGEFNWAERRFRKRIKESIQRNLDARYPDSFLCMSMDNEGLVQLIYLQTG